MMGRKVERKASILAMAAAIPFAVGTVGHPSYAEIVPYWEAEALETSTAGASFSVEDAGEDIRKAEAFQRLRDIQAWKDGWDGEHARAIPENVIHQAQIILADLHHVPEIYPTGRRTVQFQYEKEDRSYLEFEIFQDHIGMLYVPQRKYEEAVEKTLHPDEWVWMDPMVERFLEA